MSLGNMEQRTGGIVRQAKELIEQAYQRGYKEGQVNNQEFHESICDGCKKGFEDREMELIEYGREEAWDAARKIMSQNCAYWGMKDMKEIFGLSYSTDIMLDLSASEAIEKIRAYEEWKRRARRLKSGMKL